jgi:hypothetical protein
MPAFSDGVAGLAIELGIICRKLESLPTSSQIKRAPVGALLIWLGAPGEIRTPDLLVRSQTLYPTELRARDVVLNRGGEGGIHGRLRRLVPCAGSAGSGSNPGLLLRGFESLEAFTSFVAEREGFEPSKGLYDPLLP